MSTTYHREQAQPQFNSNYMTTTFAPSQQPSLHEALLLQATCEPPARPFTFLARPLSAIIAVPAGLAPPPPAPPPTLCHRVARPSITAPGTGDTKALATARPNAKAAAPTAILAGLMFLAKYTFDDFRRQQREACSGSERRRQTARHTSVRVSHFPGKSLLNLKGISTAGSGERRKRVRHAARPFFFKEEPAAKATSTRRLQRSPRWKKNSWAPKNYDRCSLYIIDSEEV